MARNSLLLDQAVESGEKKKKSRRKLIVGLAMLGVIPVVGSTLAASISLNSGSDIEFGQGTSAVVACDSSITLTPNSTFSGSTFTLSTIVATNIDSTACNGKKLTLKAYDSSGTLIAIGASSATYLEATVSGTSVTFTTSGSPNSQNLARLTLESSN